MKSLVIYDSQFGNTERVAQAIAVALNTQAVPVGKASNDDLQGLDWLFIGSPVQAGNATKSMQKFVDQIPAEILKSLKVATFDTRIKNAIVKIFGYAANRLAKKLTQKGAKVAPNVGAFIVTGTEGPLVEGEAERAVEWAKTLLEQNQ